MTDDNQALKFTIPKEAYYLVTLPGGEQKTLLLEIGKTYTLEALHMISKLNPPKEKQL